MIGYPSRLLGRTEVAQDTMAFQFERPRNFLFKAGQSIDLTLPGLLHGRSNGLTHTFSVASCPSDDEVVPSSQIGDDEIASQDAQGDGKEDHDEKEPVHDVSPPYLRSG